MVQTIALPNGRYETILRDSDFEDLIARYMGDDAANFYRHQINACLAYIDELAAYPEKENFFFDIPQGTPKEFRHENGFE